MNAAEKAARQRLGEQIANHNATEAELERGRKLLDEARRKLYSMQDEAEKAESRAAEEMDAEVERILSGVPKARTKVQSPLPTEDELDLQGRVIARLEEHVEEGARAVAVAKEAVKAAVSGVVVTKVRDLIPEMERVRSEFIRLAAAFNAARSAMEFDRDGPYARVDNLLRAEPTLLRAEPTAAIRFAALAPGEEARWKSAIA
jgi:chromosome segregation ATPase